MRITNNYIFFWGSEFSNFYKCNIEYLDFIFNCSEQAFMYCKAAHFQDENTGYLILNAKTPQEAKKLGRLVTPYNDKEWDRVRYHYMYDVVKAKFTQNDNLKSLLLSDKFKGKTFVEASPYDRIWGIGMGENNPDILDTSKWGRNLLGNIITEIRDEINKIIEKNINS